MKRRRKLRKRAILIVLDSFGIGFEPDADLFGDVGANTIKSCSTSKYFDMPNMKKLGLFNIEGVDVGEKEGAPIAIYGRAREKSMGKDTTIGHWEISGIISPKPLPTYPNGFPEDVLNAFSEATGRGVLCNKPYSGTDVIRDYGEEHLKTGNLIVYTSADSVFQIAAHEDVVDVNTLYEYCRIARKILVNEHGVGRVIARPFVGEPGNFTRTSKRHDFSIMPPRRTMLNELMDNGYDTLAVGKIQDIFVGEGISEFTYTSGNEEGINKTLEWMDRDFNGLMFVNLVDYDMLYGHRRDIDGYAKALAYFDKKLPEIFEKMSDEDLLIITADHGCDPGFLKTTDHTREYIPVLVYNKKMESKDLGTLETFADIGASVLDYFGVEGKISGTSIF